MTSSDQPHAWKIVVHGGAGILERDVIGADQEREIRAALANALEVGSDILTAGGSALDAVEAAVKKLEDNAHFNAGRGSVFTYQGTTELDAAIMEGRERRSGAVAGATATRNPVSLARAVMEKSPHVMLSGGGADQFSRDQGLEQAGPEWFSTPARRQALDDMLSNRDGWFDVDMKYGTVGAVALDTGGHVAAATSTGGITGKRWGRIGDSPIIGAGTYADDRAGAVSATGSGEYFIREAAAHEICARVRMLGQTAKAASDAVIAEVGELGGTGGFIFVSRSGEAGWSFNSAGMYRGKASADGMVVQIFGDE
ncbi:MAG TPA: isoaspartyl peptidase/L-asparaginase [Allosphingosinicella sp.]|jgi:beta-aspartyl-peptidase (threonine type)